MALFVVPDDEKKARIKQVIQYATEHPITLMDQDDMNLAILKPVGDNPEYVVDIEVGYRVVFSFELQTAGKIRHLSISVDRMRKLPNPAIAKAIMELFEFKNTLEDCKIWIEPLDNGNDAINIAEVEPY